MLINDTDLEDAYACVQAMVILLETSGAPETKDHDQLKRYLRLKNLCQRMEIKMRKEPEQRAKARAKRKAPSRIYEMGQL